MTNGSQDEHVNGLSNGYIEPDSSHKSSSKYKDKDKYRDKDRRSSTHRDKESSSDKQNSSKSKDKYRDKDREREKDKERDKHKSSSHKSSSRDKYKEREKDSNKEKDRNRDREKDKHRERDKEKTKEKSERDYDKRDRDNDRKHRKEHKSSNSDKDRKDRDRDRYRRDSSRDRDRDREHHKNSKDSKHSNSSSSKSRDKDKDKEKHSRGEKDRSIVAENKYHDENNVKCYTDCTVGGIKVDSTDGYSQEYNYELPEQEPKIEKYDYESKTEFKEEPPNLNMSQASSCDYSMSQFRDDEPNFVVKHDMTDESQNNTMDGYNSQIKQYEEDDDDDVPLAKRKAVLMEVDSDDDVPLDSRKHNNPGAVSITTTKRTRKDKKEKKTEKKRKSRDDDKTAPAKKRVKKEVDEGAPVKERKKKEEENQDVWRWWEEEKRDDGVKWHYLEHKGPVFAPPYEKLPDNINFYYDGKLMKLSANAEEVACFYAKMLNHDYITKKVFNDNFFKDWRKSMTSKEKDIIRDLSKCNFKQMHEYFLEKSEQNKNRSKDEKKAIKEANEELIKEYGFCTIDGHKERIGNFKLEPPGLFRGRGEHPKMGLVKRRVMPEDVSINCSKDSKIPQPPRGHKWKEVRHDNTVTWLASWIENVQGQVKYIMLNPSSKLKGEKDYQKYEVARRLDKQIDKIRATYRDEWKSKEMRIRQRGVALYFIDRLALRAGNEKDEDQADTVGCCSLRVEHVQLHKELNGKENVVVFDFLGKDSIRYYNEVEVEKRVFKNLELFMENKKEGDDLFDRLNTAILNEHLRDIMEGLTAKVFRTYNASITLQNQLDLLTDPGVSIQEKLLAYNRANRAVAVLCNHQRSIPKSHAKSMENLKEKIRQKKEAIKEASTDLKNLQKQAKRGSVKEKMNADKKSNQLEKLKEQLKKLELQETDRDENKTIALGTSKLNYLDPRITVAWCKKYGVPIEKIFNKTHREKFRWAIHMADENYRF